MSCIAKHTRYQPTEEDWKCPKCKKGHEENGLCIDYPDETADDACEKLHEADALRCYGCGYEASGRTFAAKLEKLHNLVTCPHCQGKGLVKA